MMSREAGSDALGEVPERRWATWIVAFPVLVAVVAVVGRSWTPAGDLALQTLQISEVGTSRTPLTGVWSRWGWNHPGPIQFYLLAPFAWVFGPTGTLIGTGLLNLASLVGAVVIGRRRGGPPIAAAVAVVALVLAASQGPDLLVSMWNPWAAVLPFFVFLLLVWSMAERDLVVLPFLVAAGSFVVQQHVGYAPFVVVLVTLAVLLMWRPASTRAADRDRSGRTEDELDPTPPLDPTRWRRPALWTGVVLVVMWLPVAIEELIRDPGNITLFARYASSPPEPSVSWRLAVDIVDFEIGVPGAWVTGREFTDLSPSGFPFGAVAVIVLLAALGIGAARCRAGSAVRLAVVAAVATALGVATTTRVAGYPFDYLFRWWWVIGALIWTSILTSGLALLHRSRPGSESVSPRVLLAVAGCLALVLGVRSLDVDPPNADYSIVAADLEAQLDARLDPDASYLYRYADAFTIGYIPTGVFVALDRSGYEVYADRGRPDAYDSWHYADPSDVDMIIDVIGDDDAKAGFPAPEGSTVVATHDPLGSAQRARADELWADIVGSVGVEATPNPNVVDDADSRARLAQQGADPDALVELAALRTAGPRYVAYLTPA